jgi:glycosyltransferase involved in cell wall biosynthesis
VSGNRDVAAEKNRIPPRGHSMATIPAVSVILPTHNRPHFLREALASLIAQKESRWEAIIVDDASDIPVDISAFSDQLRGRARVIRHTYPQGGAAAKNTGITHAAAPLVAFLDDDDVYATDYLSRAIDVLDRHREIDVLYMGVSWFGAGRESSELAYEAAMKIALAEAHGTLVEADVFKFGRALIVALLKTVPMAFQRPVVRARALREIGPYEAFCFSWDCDWALRASLHGNAALLNVGLYGQRVDGQQYSSRPSRERDRLLSVIESKDRLSLGLPKNDHRLREHFVQARAYDRFCLARYYARNCQPHKAFDAWIESLQLAFVPRRVNFLGRIVACTIKRLATRSPAA